MPTFAPLGGLFSLGQQGQGSARQGAPLASLAMQKLGVPAPARLYLQAMAGRKQPVTESDFRPDELNAMRALIQAAQQQGHQHAVTYDPYYAVYQSKAVPAADADNIRNSLGRFNFNAENGGGYTVTDKYDFDNEFRHKQVEKYKNMNAAQKIGDILANTASRGASALRAHASLPGAIQYAVDPGNGLFGMAGAAFVGDGGVPVHIAVPPQAAAPAAKPTSPWDLLSALKPAGN